MIQIAILVTILCPAADDADFSHIEPKVVVQQGEVFMMRVAAGQQVRGATRAQFKFEKGALDGLEIVVVMAYPEIVVPYSLHLHWMMRRGEYFMQSYHMCSTFWREPTSIARSKHLDEVPVATKDEPFVILPFGGDYRPPSEREYRKKRYTALEGARATDPLGSFFLWPSLAVESMSEVPRNFWVDEIGEVDFFHIYNSQMNVYRSYAGGYVYVKSFPSPFFGDFEVVEQNDYVYFITVSSGAYRVPLSKVRMTTEEEERLPQDDEFRNHHGPLFVKPNNPYFEDIQMEKMLATEDLDVRVILEDQDRDWLGVITPTAIYNLEDPGTLIEIPKKITKQIANPDATPIDIVRALYPIIHPDAGYTPAENLIPQQGLTGQIKQHPIIWAAALLAIAYATIRKRRTPHKES